MKTHATIAVSVLLAAHATGLTPAEMPEPALPSPILVTGARVLTMNEETVLSDHAILVEDGRITWVGPANEAPEGPDRLVIDAQGGYLLPGLTDAHVHLGDLTELPLYLAAGVTTIVELGGPDHRQWRDALERGALLGPRLLTCGPTISAESAGKGGTAVAAHAAAGYDCIKIYDEMPFEVFEALAAKAKELGLLSTAHIPRNLGWEEMLGAAPDAVAHAEEFLYSSCCSEEDVLRIGEAMRDRAIALITTLATYDNITAQVADLDLFLARQPRRFFPPVQFRAWRPPLNRYASFDPDSVLEMRRLFDFQRWLIARLHGAGVRIVTGTDAGNTGTFPGLSVAEELAWLVRSGLSPYDALVTATTGASRWMGHEAPSGSIGVGAPADLLLVAGNPLDDIGNLRFVRGVVSRGRWFDHGQLQSMREQVAQSFALEAELVDRIDAGSVQSALEWLADVGGRPRVLALDELGYQKLKLEEAPEDAVRLFTFNVRLYPNESRVHASLAEGLLAIGETARSEESAARARELAPAEPNPTD